MIIGITGPPRSGKTHLGNELSRQLNLPSYDLDELIAQEMQLSPHKELFEMHGFPTSPYPSKPTLEQRLSGPEQLRPIYDGVVLSLANQILYKLIHTESDFIVNWVRLHDLPYPQNPEFRLIKLSCPPRPYSIDKLIQEVRPRG